MSSLLNFRCAWLPLVLDYAIARDATERGEIFGFTSYDENLFSLKVSHTLISSPYVSIGSLLHGEHMRLRPYRNYSTLLGGMLYLENYFVFNLARFPIQ